MKKLSRSVAGANYIDHKLIKLRSIDEVTIDNLNIVHACSAPSIKWNGYRSAAIITDLGKDEGLVMPKGCTVKFVEQENGDWLVCISDTDTLSSAYALLTHDGMQSILNEASEHIG